MLTNSSVRVLTILLLIASSVLSLSVRVDDRTPCTEDFTPCTCDQATSGGGWTVTCDRVPIAEVQALFNRTTVHNLSSFSLSIAESETSGIPSNFFSNSRAESITINCLSPFYNLTVKDDAFLSSGDVTKSLTVNGCDLQEQLNFVFMSGFSNLASLSIYRSMNFRSFGGIPSQSKLFYISIVNSTGFNELDSANVTLPGLRILYLYDNQLNDAATARILQSLAGSSTGSLQELRLYNNRLTRVPSLISSFSSLNQLMMEHNNIDLITTRTLAFYSYVSYLHLGSNGIRSIEPSSFGGNSFGSVYLHQNNLTRFESYVFQTMLEGMVKDGFGSLSLYENPIICDCRLAWLIQYKRNLLPAINGGQCSNSTLFTELNPEGFNGCPVFTCPEGIDGNFPNPLSCQTYYICSGGVEVLASCPGGLVFNPAYQMCDWPFNVPTCNAGR